MKPLFYFQVMYWERERWNPTPRVAPAFDVKAIEKELLAHVVNTQPYQFTPTDLVVNRCNDGMLYVRCAGDEWKVFEMSGRQGSVHQQQPSNQQEETV